jgi:hypothetical protein
MERLTEEINTVYITKANNIIPIANGVTGPAINRLAQFENSFQALTERQNATITELERLKKEGKQSTVLFKELLGKKLTYQYILDLFKTHGIN